MVISFLLFISRTLFIFIFIFFAYVAEQGCERRHYYLTLFNRFKSVMDRLLRKGRTEELGKVKLLKNKKKRVKQFKNSLERRFFFFLRRSRTFFPPFVPIVCHLILVFLLIILN